MIDSSGLMSLCVEEVSRFISDTYVQQWVCGPPQRLVVGQIYSASLSTRHSTQ